MRWVIAAVAAVGILATSSAQAATAIKAVAEHQVETVKPIEAMTLSTACCVLTDLKPGLHKITVIHPYTCCPVDVCFCLPCGCYSLQCGRGLCCEKLRFSYPGLCNDVVVKFCKSGCVVVKD